MTVKACWFLTADYHGLNWNWLSRHANSDNSLDGDKEDFVSAFGTRGNR